MGIKRGKSASAGMQVRIKRRLGRRAGGTKETRNKMTELWA
jgi:hypothetical protein